MPAKPLSETQKQDAERLKKIFLARKAEDPTLTQESLAHACGWANQSSSAAYINGKIPLNFDALIKLSEVLKVSVDQISPSLAYRLMRARIEGAANTMDVTSTAIKVAESFDKLNTSQKIAVLSILRSYDSTIPDFAAQDIEDEGFHKKERAKSEGMQDPLSSNRQKRSFGYS